MGAATYTVLVHVDGQPLLPQVVQASNLVAALREAASRPLPDWFPQEAGLIVPPGVHAD